MFTCFIRYSVDPEKLDDFKEYAHSWMALIRKYGGIHHGYFIPGTDADELPRPAFSFPGLGRDGPPNIAVALFSFPSVEAYDKYRQDVADDAACAAATAKFNATNPFSGYERTILVPVFE